MNTVKGYRVYINHENGLLPSNTFFDVVGYINNRQISGDDVIRDIETSQYYLVIYYEEDYFAIECLPYSGFNPKNKIIDFSEVRWLTDTNLKDFPEIKIVYDFGLYKTRGVELIDTLPEEVLQSFRNCIYASYYEFDQTIQDDKIFRVQYKLVDNKNYVKSLFNKINIDSIFEQTQFLHLELIPTQENTQFILKQENNILISESNSQNYLQNQVSTNGLNINIILDDILGVGTYKIIIPQQSIFLFGQNGQVEYNNGDQVIEFSIVQSGDDQNQTDHEITLYNKLLKIQNSSLNINNFVKRLLGTDTIIIKKNPNYNITLKPVLCKTTTTTQGAVNENVPITDVSTVLLTYSFYQDEVLVSHNVQIQYNQDLDLLDIIQDLNVDYIKILVQFNYKQTLIQQGFELYFVNAAIYQYITTNQEYVLEGNIDMSNGQPAVTRCGCLLLTNRYDAYETFETIENEQTVIKGVADIVPNTKVRMGNLTGIHNYKFGTNQPRGYGLYGESVYLTGNFYLNNGRSLVDIDRDILFANGNIREVQRLLESLDNSIRATIEANSTMVEANYLGAISGAISTNNNVILRLGQDYSLWALGNAGIALINPNATYTGTGEVNPSTVGDGDESILLQGENIKFATNNTVTIDGVVYHEMICSRTSPASWEYNGNIYLPSNLNNNFFVAYISGNVLASCQNVHFDRAENQVSQEYLKYVAFNYIPVTATQDSNLNPPYKPTDFSPSLGDNAEYYLFNNCYLSSNLQFKLKISENAYTQNDISNTINGNIYLMPRVKVAGMFKNGKFNADLIETKNILAYDEQTQANGISKYRKNPEFSFNDPVSDQNYPVQSKNDQGVWETDKTAPFAVISGETGRISTQGVDLREAKVEQENGNQSIHIVNNDGFKETSDPTANYPAIYFKKGDQIRTKISSIGEYTQEDSPAHYYETPQTIINSNSQQSIQFSNLKLLRRLYTDSLSTPYETTELIEVNGSQSSLATKVFDNYGEYKFTLKLRAKQYGSTSAAAIIGRYKLNEGAYHTFNNLISEEITIGKIRYTDTLTIELKGTVGNDFTPVSVQQQAGTGEVTWYSITIGNGTVENCVKYYDNNEPNGYKTKIVLTKFVYLTDSDGDFLEPSNNLRYPYGQRYIGSGNYSGHNYGTEPYQNNGIITISVGPINLQSNYQSSSTNNNYWDGRATTFNYSTWTWYKQKSVPYILSNSQINNVRYIINPAQQQNTYSESNDIYSNFYAQYDDNTGNNNVLSDCRKFIKIIKKFTIEPGQSKHIILDSACADITLNTDCRLYYKKCEKAGGIAAQGNPHYVYDDYLKENDTQTIDKFLAFGGYISLISGFRVTYQSSRIRDVDSNTFVHTLNHKWISQSICTIKRDKTEEYNTEDEQYEYIISKDSLALKSFVNKQYNKNSIDIINETDHTRTYYLEYVSLIQMNNKYDKIDYVHYTLDDDNDEPVPIPHGNGMIVPYDNELINDMSGFVEEINSDKYVDSDNFHYISLDPYPNNVSSEINQNWHPAQSPIYYTINGNVTLKNYKLQIFDNKFQTNLQGNGIGLGVNLDNYFGTYLINGQTSSTNFKFLSGGNGLQFSENGFQNFLFGYNIDRYIPIMQGQITYNGNNSYTFYGNSLIHSNTNNIITQATDVIYSDHSIVSNLFGHSISFGNININYQEEYDIYILSTDHNYYPYIDIIFGDKWNTIFNKFKFSENQIFVNLQGCQRKYQNGQNYVDSFPILPVFKGSLNFYDSTTQCGLLLPTNDDSFILSAVYGIKIDLFKYSGDIYTNSSSHYSFDTLGNSSVYGDFIIQINYSPKI